MGSKRKLNDTTVMFSSASSTSESSAPSPASKSSDDEREDELDVFYESKAGRFDGKTSYSASFMTLRAPPSPVKSSVPQVSHANNPGGSWVYDFVDNDWALPQPNSDTEDLPPVSEIASSGSETEGPTKREPYRPVKKWKDRYRNDFLDEFLRVEGRGDHVYATCICGHPECDRGTAEFRCKDCHGCELLSKVCMLRDHRRRPLHRVEIWDQLTGYFRPSLLKALGLKVYLSTELHHDGICPHFRLAPNKNFVVIDTNGLHDLELYYCDCGKGSSFPVQLLRRKWFPSTGNRPGTAATFNVLRNYHLMSLESKCSMGEFYNTLSRLTNNSGDAPKSRYQEFINMTREWRNLQILKRGARAHETDGIANTPEGACALECPACPHPGRNLPPEWKDVPAEQRFLYALFLALDANFRMQRKDVSSETADANLGDGLAFFGKVTEYMEYLEKNWAEPQPKSTCVAHDAVNTPDREARGTASSGVVTVDCARHNMKRPRGVGDLQAGERYLNVDWMFFMSLEGSDLLEFYVSYDIVCQWHKNIWHRLRLFPRQIREEYNKRYFVFLVPKFHLPAHIESCNIKFSFLFTPYVGQTDGEAPERGWSNINPLALSTREMSPHLRRETLDDHFNHWNWKKILSMGTYFLDRIQHYIPEMLRTRRETLQMERTLPAETLEEWKEMCVAWEANAACPNPFERTQKQIDLASVRLQLTVEGGGMVRGEINSTEMLSMGVKLESEQRELKFDQATVGLHPTVTQKRLMLERCSKLRRKVLSWMETQTQFMPSVAVVRAEASAKRQSPIQPAAGELVQDIPLLMPSTLAPDVACPRELQEFEFRLREGQAHEALYEMRHQLLIRTHEYKWKDEQNHNVRDGTRSHTKLKLIEDRLTRASTTYRVAWGALKVLGSRLGKQGWEGTLQVLEDGDVRGMPEATFRKPGKRRKETASARKKRKKTQSPISWIWLADGSAADADRNPAMNEALRIEWAKTRALGMRNTEEVALLEEEMRRVPEFLRWRAAQWDAAKDHSPPSRRPDLIMNPRLGEGFDAYASRQAQLMRDIATRFETKWTGAGVKVLVADGRTQVANAEAEAEAEAVAQKSANAEAEIPRGDEEEGTDADDEEEDEGDADGSSDGE
ncbi:CxC2 domain-containing protein [Favolaschia claudopus]|uniref:CxC2 domain-containing protein n=1 Tax=Favolaschia claudopus TaxID=2862362 RepID=A0AAW0BUI6_9AGAR